MITDTQTCPWCQLNFTSRADLHAHLGAVDECAPLWEEARRHAASAPPLTPERIAQLRRIVGSR